MRLGVNIDHVATLRNARGEGYPDVVRAALEAEKAGADGITIHLREDRRHIRDEDVPAILSAISIPMNLEIAASEAMLAYAVKLKPHAVCLVPEKRQELTTEGGLNLIGTQEALAEGIARLSNAGIRVSLFIDPDFDQIRAASKLGAAVVELHTGSYARYFLQNGLNSDATQQELERIRQASTKAHALGLEVHAGHGLTFDNVQPIAQISVIKELNIGHFLIAEATFTGLDAAIKKMALLMQDARHASR